MWDTLKKKVVPPSSQAYFPSVLHFGLLGLLLGTVAHAQSVATLRPPEQTYIYDFGGTVSAPIPATQAVNLGASFTIEFWMMLDRDAVDNQVMRVFQKGIPNAG